MQIKRKNIRNLLGAFFGYSLLLFGSVRKAKKDAFSGNYITGIAFHNPSKNIFESSILWLKRNGYVFISTDKLYEILTNNVQSLPGAVWITLDDGWKSNLENVIPTVNKYNIPVTIFVSTGPVQSNGIFWWELLKKYENKLEELYYIKPQDVYNFPENKRKKIISNLENLVKKNYLREAMSIDQVKTIAKMQQVTIGCHTVNHVILSNCNEDELLFEIGQSKRTLEKWINKEVLYFAYPNGNFDGRESNLLGSLGFKIAATIENKLISSENDPYLVPRFVAYDNGILIENICHITGVWQPWITKVKNLLQF